MSQASSSYGCIQATVANHFSHVNCINQHHLNRCVNKEPNLGS